MSKIINYGDVKLTTFDLGEIRFTVDKNIIYHIMLINAFLPQAEKNGKQYPEIHKQFSSANDFLENCVSRVAGLISKAVDNAVQILIDAGIYNITGKELWKYIQKTSAWEYFASTVQLAKMQLNEINDDYAEQLEYRAERKANRNRAVGIGFGFSGMIKSAVAAGTVNMATGALHSMANAVGNVGSAIGKGASEYMLLHDNEIINDISESCWAITMTLPEIIYKIVTKKENVPDYSQAETLFNNVSQYQMTREKKKDIYKEIFTMCPFNAEYYKGYIREFGDVNGNAESTAKYFGCSIAQTKKEIICEKCKAFDENAIPGEPVAGHMVEHTEKCEEFIKKMREIFNYMGVSESDDLNSSIMIRPQGSRAEISYKEFLTKSMTVDGKLYRTMGEVKSAAAFSDKMYILREYIDKPENTVPKFDDRSENLEKCIRSSLDVMDRVEKYASSLGLSLNDYSERIMFRYAASSESKQKNEANGISYSNLQQKCLSVDRKQYAKVNESLAAAVQWDNLHKMFLSVNKDDHNSVCSVIEQIKGLDYTGDGKKDFLEILNGYEIELRTVNGIILDTFEQAEEARKKVTGSKEYITEKYQTIEFYRFTADNRKTVTESLSDVINIYSSFAHEEWTEKCEKFIKECMRISRINRKALFLKTSFLLLTVIAADIVMCYFIYTNVPVGTVISAAVVLRLCFMYIKNASDLIKCTSYFREKALIHNISAKLKPDSFAVKNLAKIIASVFIFIFIAAFTAFTMFLATADTGEADNINTTVQNEPQQTGAEMTVTDRLTPENGIPTENGILYYTFENNVITIDSYEGTDKTIDLNNAILAIGLSPEEYTLIIGDDAFKGCRTLESIYLGNTEGIGNNAFAQCEGLVNVTFGSVKDIGNRAFYQCAQLTQADMPEVDSIKNAAFAECGNLASVNMPKVTVIGNIAFEDCTKLTDADLPRAEKIGTSAFTGCINLTRADMPNVKAISAYSFKDCIKLETVLMPIANEVGNFSFENCKSLETVEIKDDISSLSTTAFSGSGIEAEFAEMLKSIVYTAVTPNGQIDFTIDDTTVYLKKYTGNDKEIDSFIISEALKDSGYDSYEQIEIGEECFAGSPVEIAHINGFDKVGTRAFAGCKNLNELWCGGDLGDYAFEGCINLKAASISPMEAYDFSYTVSIGKGCFKDSGLKCLSIADYDLVDYSISEDAFEGTPIETAVNSPNTAKIYNSTAMRFFPEKFEDCDFELHVSLSVSPFDYDEYIYANIVTDGSGSIGEAIAFEKTPELENISAEATEELDIICIFTGKMASRFEYGYGDVGVPLYTIKEIKNPEAIGEYNDSSYLRLSDFSEDEILAFGFEDKYYDTGFMIDIYVLDTDGGKAGNFIGFDMLSDYNVRTVAYYPGGTDIGKVYRVYGRFRGFYTDETGYTYLDFETDKYDDVTEEYF